ncbi:hypothetical protein [Marinicella litoralis]|uniref:Peptidoglycan-binding protein CsiV n=1 Tax=Marinicella litoralis TaxID=644220 RepID=A0A4R6XRI6_9GAMM|nr:hypothetical protein [Marinicella litoralis]TDR22502.1 hypothetical protein C8D91_0993 [Marinicella litoralis]
MKPITLFKTCLIGTWLIIAMPSFSQSSASNLLPEANRNFEFDYEPIEPIAFATFEAAAAWADVVAIAQVVNIDYLKTRDLNSQGQGFLTVRVPYKGVKKNDLLIVSSKGFEDHVCYYPDRIEEGERFLVFLKESKNQGEYHGFKPFCQLQILLTDTGEYALRYPLDAKIDVPSDLIEDITYNDPHAVIDVTDWTHIRREEYQQAFSTTLTEDSDLFQKYFYLTYNKGIMIYKVRKLMNIKAEPRISSKQM